MLGFLCCEPIFWPATQTLSLCSLAGTRVLYGKTYCDSHSLNRVRQEELEKLRKGLPSIFPLNPNPPLPKGESFYQEFIV